MANAAMAAIEGIVADTINEAGSNGIPDGHLYMYLQSALGEKWTIDVHTSVISSLVAAKKITKRGHLLLPAKK